MLRAVCATLRRVRGPSAANPLPSSRLFTTGGTGSESGSGSGSGSKSGNGDDDPDDDDDFTFDDFTSALAEDDKASAALSSLPEAASDLTPELAASLVAKLVRSPQTALAPTGSILPAITSHTVSVLRACRVSTNAIQAAGSDVFEHPITKKIVLTMDIDALRLSAPAEEALRRIAGQRVKDDVVRFAADRFTMREENHAYAVSLADRLVAAAKTAVGEVVDGEQIGSWEDVEKEVERQGVAEGWDGRVLQQT